MRITAISIVAASLFTASAVAATAGLPTPAEMLSAAPVPDEFELASDELRSQNYDEFSGTSPYSVGHVLPGTSEADQLLAGQDVWGVGADDTMLREVVRWSSADVAEQYQLEVVDYATGDALAEIEAPFEGARAFSGSDPVAGVWVRIVVWTDGPYGAAISHFAAGGDPSDEAVNAAAVSLASETAAAAAPTPADTVDDNRSESDDDSGGGISLATVLLFVAIAGGAIWLFLRLRKRVAKAGDTPPDSADDAPSASPGSSADDIVDEARRRAREEVERTSETWQPPDDY